MFKKHRKMEMDPLLGLPLFLEQAFRALSHFLLGHDHLTHTGDFSLHFCDILSQLFHRQGIDFARNKPLIGRVERQAVFFRDLDLLNIFA